MRKEKTEVRKKEGKKKGEKGEETSQVGARYPGSWRFNQDVPLVSDISDRERTGGGLGEVKRGRQTGARRTVQTADSMTAA